MVRVQTSQTDPWLARIDRCLQAIDAWSRRTTDAESPQPGSQLASDDARNPSLPASTIAWSSIGSAVDHLGLAEDALRREGGARLRPMAFYTVCRAALVAASQAIWVMTGSRDVRLRRVRLIEREEAGSFKQFLDDYARDEHLHADTTAEFIEGLQRKVTEADQRHKQLTKDLRPKRGEYTVTRTLREAADEVVGDNGQDRWLRRAYMFEWRAASGDAHARLWTRAVRPHEDIPLIGQRARLRITTGTTQTYGQSLGAATLAVSHAFRLWEEQTNPRTDP